MNGVQGFIHDQLGDRIPQARTDEIMGETVILAPYSNADRAGKGPQVTGLDSQ